MHFHAVARHGSLRRAAEALHLTPPALTRSLQNLEAELGVILCRRGRAGVRLSDEGRRLLRTTERILAELEHYLDSSEAPDRYGGIVGLGFLDRLSIPRVDRALDAMLAAFPACRPSLISTSSDALDRLVEREELDLAFSVFDRQRPQLRYRPVAREPFRYYISPRHPLWSRRAIRRADLEGQRVVWLDHERIDRAELEATVFRDVPGQAMRVAAFADHFEGGLRLLLSGYAVVPMPRTPMRDLLRERRVRELRIVPPVPELVTYCVDKPERPASPPVAFLLESLGLQGTS